MRRETENWKDGLKERTNNINGYTERQLPVCLCLCMSLMCLSLPLPVPVDVCLCLSASLCLSVCLCLSKSAWQHGQAKAPSGWQ